MYRKFYGAADEAAAKAAIDSLSPKLDVYEKILLKQKYLAGDVRVHPHLSVLCNS